MIQSKLIEKKDFIGQEISVGLDVHKKNWNVIIYVEKVFFKEISTKPESGSVRDVFKK